MHVVTAIIVKSFQINLNISNIVLSLLVEFYLPFDC